MDPLVFTAADRRFLKSLRISPDDAPPKRPLEPISDELMRRASVPMADFMKNSPLFAPVRITRPKGRGRKA